MKLDPHVELTISLGEHPKASITFGIGPHPTGSVRQVEAGVESAALDLLKPLTDDAIERISESITGVTK